MGRAIERFSLIYILTGQLHHPLFLEKFLDFHSFRVILCHLFLIEMVRDYSVESEMPFLHQ
jgi:hypothetical protein